MTAYAIALFSYFVDRSADHILPYVSLPAVVLAALWLSLVLRDPGIAPRVRRGALAFALALSVLLISTAWSSVGDRFPRTALARALPGGEGLRASLDRLWHPPPLDPRAPVGEALLDRYFPGRERVPILVAPDLGTEILVRSGRTDAFRLTDPWEDSFVPEQRLPGVLEGVRELHRGDLILMDLGSFAAYDALSRRPAGGLLSGITASGSLAPLQQVALQRISRRFALRPVDRDPAGLVVVRLVPRR